jgi:hypothetical protein
MADVRGRWANRNDLRVYGGYDVRVVGFRGPQGNPNGDWTSPCQYKFNIARSANFTFVGGEMGEPTDDANVSFIATQRAQRTLVRSSRFWGTRTYAFDEHGEGSRHFLFENNYLAAGPNARYGAVFLGHDEFGFTGPGIVRNNTFEGNWRDVNMEENSYEVRVLDNIMRNTVDRAITGYGWAGPDTATDLDGSIRWTIARNRISGAKDGIVLGEATSPIYPYLGVKDVLVTDNQISVSGRAIALMGDATATRRFQVRNNSGSATYVHPAFVAGDNWAGNGDGTSYGSPTAVRWSQPYFAWETFDQTG